jgi:serine protease AprX
LSVIDTSTSVASAARVDATTDDTSVRLLGDNWKPDKDLGSFYTLTKTIGAQDMWSRSDSLGAKYTGAGIGVALIDSGVVPVEGLTVPGKVINGPDLSFDSLTPELRHLDSYGHGTHMAGIIAGRDAAVKEGNENDSTNFVGVAPGAHIVSVKVAASDGATDVSQVIAAIDWVVAHRNDPGLNIRVMNLSFGTTALQSYQLDPLAYAVEQAWLKGIVVVVAAGNDGSAGTTLNNPAINPYVIAVGASDHSGTQARDDDRLADFSSVGGWRRAPDVVAPGRSVVSLRAPGSYLDERYSTARVTYNGSTRFFRGSGSSQAAAVVSGVAALLLDEQPTLTPDQVKFLLKANADRIGGSWIGQGAGLVDLKDIAAISPTWAPIQKFTRSTGTGSLELARGGSHVADATTGVELIGEFDIFGRAWNGAAWAAASANGTAWTGGMWNGSTWTGDGWGGTSWTGKTWRSTVWTDNDWTGKTWRAEIWDGKTWRGSEWTGKTWRDSTWTGKTWRDSTWTGRVWR